MTGHAPSGRSGIAAASFGLVFGWQCAIADLGGYINICYTYKDLDETYVVKTRIRGMLNLASKERRYQLSIRIDIVGLRLSASCIRNTVTVRHAPSDVPSRNLVGQILEIKQPSKQNKMEIDTHRATYEIRCQGYDVVWVGPKQDA